MAVQSITTTYQTGSTGDNVREIQSLLTQRGYSPGPVDGIFGPLTKTAVMRFQSDRGITIDGIVGPTTWAMLHGNLTPIPAPAPLTVQQAPSVPTTITLQPGASAQLIAGLSPIQIIVGGLGILTIVAMSGGKTRKRKR